MFKKYRVNNNNNSNNNNNNNNNNNVHKQDSLTSFTSLIR